MPPKTPIILLLAFLVLALPCLCFGEGFAEGVSARTRNRYRTQNGIIIPPEEIRSDSWIGSFDYHYPDPESDLGVYVYNRLNPPGPLGRDGLLQIGLKGKSQGFSGLPPLNLTLVVDTSATMKEGGRIEWIKDSLVKLAGKLRPSDSLALVSFNDSPQVVFESALMDSQEKNRAFTAAVNSLDPRGGTDLEAGLGMGYEQAKIHYHERSVNLVLLFSDGDEFSSRLAQAYAHSGDIRISLMWDNRNDLDLHVVTPGGEEIYFHNMRDSSGGWLDVDRNVLGETTEPVENIFWYDDSAAKGEYQVWVQNYGFHEPNRNPYPFRVEIKNGGGYNYYDGVVSNYGRASNKLVCTFEYQGNDTLAGIFEMAELHRQQGVSVSALGIGGNFDEELLRALAAYGQGSLREANNREELIKIFDNDREFERIAVLAARAVEMELEFSSLVEIRGVWGLEHSVEGSRILCSLPSLNRGDYRTLLVRYRIPPNGGDETAGFRIKNAGNGGSAPEEIELSRPADAASSRMLILSGAMVDFAEALKEAGRLYYSENEEAGERALRIIDDTKRSLEAAAQGLRDSGIFQDELMILARYRELAALRTPGQGNSPGRRPSSRMSYDSGNISQMKY